MNTEKKRPQDRWNEKAGLISKSYKLKRDLTEEFATACDTAGVSQAGQISKMMREFIEQVKAWDPDYTKLTEEERVCLEEAENGEYINAKDIVWDD